MLSTLRAATGGIVAKILLFVLVVSFAVWGASGAFIGGSGSSTVEFGKTSVGMLDYRLAYNIQSNSLSRQFGTRLTREQARAFGLEESVLSQIIAGAVMDENARRLGLGLSTDRLAGIIAEDPTFQDSTGRFSRAVLDGVLREVGMRQEDYVRNRKAVAVRRQFLDAVAVSAEAPQAFFEALAAYQGQKRVFDYAIVEESAIGARPVATDADIQKYYDEHQQEYMAPEYRRLTVVRLTAEDISRPDLIDAETVAARYEATKSNYSTPEKRRIQQVVFPGQAEADAALARIRSGESFDAIVAETGRSATDIDLGLLAKREVPDVNVAEAAFGLELNAVSDVVDGVFGPVLLRVTEIETETTRPLAEVDDEIRKTLALEKATEDLYDVHDRLEDERAAGDALGDAARKVGLTPRQIDQVDREGKAPDGTAVADIPESDKLLSQAFETDPGVETDPISIGTSGFVWYEVEDVTPERQKTLVEVRDAAAAAWADAETARRVDELAQTIRDRVAKGETLAAVVADLLPGTDDGSPAEPSTSAELTRDAANEVFTAEALSAGFSIAREEVTVAPAAKAPARMVLQVRQVIEAEGTPVAQTVKDRISQSVSDDMLNALVAEFQSRGEVRVNQAAIETALGF